MTQPRQFDIPKVDFDDIGPKVGERFPDVVFHETREHGEVLTQG